MATNSNKPEFYDNNFREGGAQPLFDDVKQVQDINTPCTECSSIYNAKKIRTTYDQYWMQFYNSKSKNTNTDLISLQFAK